MAKFLFTMLVVNDLGLPTRASARRVAESMRKFGGAREAAERIERFAGGPLECPGHTTEVES